MHMRGGGETIKRTSAYKPADTVISRPDKISRDTKSLPCFFLSFPVSEKKNLVYHNTAECFPSRIHRNYKIQLPIHVCINITTYGEVRVWMLLKQRNDSLAPKDI